MYAKDTIAALSTGRGGAIAIIRVSGPDAIATVDKIFVARNGRPLSEVAGYTIHFGEIQDGAEVVDEVLVSVFRAPHSYTGEDSVEISCHASSYIENRILQLLLAAGARSASAGEFTLRAFLAGKMDLAQAEGVADLIASSERSGHQLAMDQMRGGVSAALAALRAELVELAALLELELDFSEEDVQFADRTRLAVLIQKISTELESLTNSFSLGNAIKEGIPVAIVGRPNAGKSTLLNALAGDDRAMVSAIAGTTRDRIEERVNLGGVGFRFIDTAGLRATEDELEQMGIERTLDAVRRARIVLLVVESGNDIETQITELDLRDDQKLCVILNKIDRQPVPPNCSHIAISAKTGENFSALTDWLLSTVALENPDFDSTVISNSRHFDALVRAQEAVKAAGRNADCGLCYAELLAEDVRQVLFHLGTITGEVTSDEILGTIFSKFCIGK